MKRLIFKERALAIAMLIGAAVSVLCGAFTAFAEECESLPDNLFRLHILANSDSEEDQALKYALRDYLLEEFTEIFDGCENAKEAREAAKASLSQIASSAKDFIAASGYAYTVTASVEKIYFTTRSYGNVTVPAGDYDALRILIGEGAGKNWWCVMFPPLCLPAAEGTVELPESEMRFLFASRKLSKGRLREYFSKAQSLSAENGEGVEVRFAVYEWLKALWEK